MTTPSGPTSFLRRTPAGDGHTRAADGFAWAAGNDERAGDDGCGHADAGNGRRASPTTWPSWSMADSGARRCPLGSLMTNIANHLDPVAQIEVQHDIKCGPC